MIAAMIPIGVCLQPEVPASFIPRRGRCNNGIPRLSWTGFCLHRAGAAVEVKILRLWSNGLFLDGGDERAITGEPGLRVASDTYMVAVAPLRRVFGTPM